MFGGSFNPAHAGHIYISNLAIKYLSLDQIWWLVVPQNPLKGYDQSENLSKRLASAKNIKKNNKIRVLDLEYNIGTRFSYDTIEVLKRSLPNINFFWIIGADNLYNMHLWYKWKKLFYLCPVVVFNRPGYFRKALSSKTAKRFWKRKVSISKINSMSKNSLPLWSFVDIRTNKKSSSQIRENKNGVINERYN